MSDTATTLQTVTGPIDPNDLGKTLMHEHLLIGYPGSETDTANPGPGRDECVARCVDRIEEMKGLGFTSMLDPCPSDLGRDVELMAKVAQITGFQIICATGLYKQSEGGYPYWQMRQNFGPTVDAMAESGFYDVLLGGEPVAESVRYTTAKIVLVGDSGVGKTGLGQKRLGLVGIEFALRQF